MNAGADRWITRSTTGCVAVLALIAGTVSYSHMRLLVELHGELGWVAAPTPPSIVPAAVGKPSSTRSGPITAPSGSGPAATSVNAELISLPDLGQVAEGCTADLLILAGNICDDPSVV